MNSIATPELNNAATVAISTSEVKFAKQGSKRRNESIDALRGIAAMGVVLFHLAPSVTLFGEPYRFVIGKYGVELFFLISGYVILMTAERKNSALAFAKARFLRLYPTFWACIAITLLFAYLLGDQPLFQSWKDLAGNAIMFPKFFGCKYVDGVYWTLELELIFYAFVFALLLIGKLNWLIPVLSLASLVTSLAYFLDLRTASLETGFAPIVFRLFFLMIDGKAHLFLTGVMFYQCQRNAWSNMYWLVVTIVILGALADERISVMLLTVVVGLFAFALRVDGKIRVHPILLWLGFLSYPLYLLHMRIGRAALEMTAESGVDSWLAFLLVATALLFLSHAVAFSVEWFRTLVTPKPC